MRTSHCLAASNRLAHSAARFQRNTGALEARLKRQLRSGIDGSPMSLQLRDCLVSRTEPLMRHLSHQALKGLSGQMHQGTVITALAVDIEWAFETVIDDAR